MSTHHTHCGNGRIRSPRAGPCLSRARPVTANAITDVPGVEVGYCTLIEGEGASWCPAKDQCVVE